ncbi:MAG: hypothetical protein IJT95_00350 [Abditibacteriota bacterium]|nr:hypothetical protein [Abditibacteriota bacterium]
MTARIFIIICILAAGIPAFAAKAYILNSDRSAVITQKAEEAFAGAGYSVRTADAAGIGELERGDVLIAVEAQRFPASAGHNFNEFIRKGGYYLGIGGLPFTEPLTEIDGRLYSAEETGKALFDKASDTLIAFTPETCSRLELNDADGEKVSSAVSLGSAGDRAVCISSPAVHSWESAFLYGLSADKVTDDSILVFGAKGDKNTPELWLGFMEQDGSRWLKKLALTDEYQYYAVDPSDFIFWDDSSAKGRGKSGDHIHFSRIKRLEIAYMASAPVTGTPQTAYVTDIRISSVPKTSGEKILTMESLYPASMIWENRRTDAVRTFDGAETPCSGPVATPLWRNRGYGLNYEGKYRQIPLACCLKNGSVTGIAAEVLVNYPSEEAPGSMWGFIGNAPGFLEQNPDYLSALLRKTASVFAGEPRLTKAGTGVFSYLPGETVTAGCAVTAGTEAAASVTVTVSDKTGRLLEKKSRNGELKPGSETVFSYSVKGLKPGLYETASTLYSSDGRLLDTLTQKFSVFDPDARSEDTVITVKDGNFWCGGSLWVPYGINYWPLYASGRESADYRTITWLFPEQYDPALIERDMEILKYLGANCISVQFTKDEEANPLRDLLERLRQYDIKVHLYVEGCHPLRLNADKAEALLKESCAAQSPSMFSYDLGWEVNCGDHNTRKSFDKEWNRWILDNYTSFEEAFAQWGYTPAEEDGYYTNPDDDMIREPEGSPAVYIAAYRSFLDEHISKGYQKIVSRLKSFDPYTLMGARSGYGGTGTAWIAHMFPFDLKSGVRHLDYTAPEAYNIGGDRKGFMMGQINNIYGRFVSGGKPVMWPEYGSPLFVALKQDDYLPHIGDSYLEKEGLYYKGMGEFLAEARANGGLGWWYPGGYRTGEASDFGIISPDYTIRPAARAIKATAPGVMKGYSQLKSFPDETITIDRDDYVTGYAGVFDAYAEKIALLTMEGKRVDLATPGSVCDSADFPLVCPGNVPYKGKGPLKYLKAEFDEIDINGRLLLESGSVTLEKGKPVTLKVRAANIEEPIWRASSGRGQVGLKVRYDDTEDFFPIIGNTGYLGTASVHTFTLKGNPARVTLRMSALGIGDFGETAVIDLEYK